MKRILYLLVLITSINFVFAQQGRELVIYNSINAVTRIPVSSIDSMKFYDPENFADFEVLFQAPEKIMDLLVQYNLVSTSHDSFGYMAILHATDMMSEDIVMSKLSHFRYDYAHDNTNYTYRRTNMIWQYFSKVIEISNNVIKNAPANPSSQPYRLALGTAYAMRAFSHYYLMQLYQFTGFYDNPQNLQLPTIPYVFAEIEPLYNQRNYRVSASEIMQFCEQDYLRAIQFLTGINRPTKNQLNVNVVNGLLARLYLLKGDWNNAAVKAAYARSGFQLMNGGDLYDGFMKIYNPEWMWGYDHTTETTTLYASFFSHISNLTAGYAGLNYAPRHVDKRLYDLIPESDSRKLWFQNGSGSLPAPSYRDQNATTWSLPYANLKFGSDGNFTQDYMYMRAAEMYLIETEALLRLGQSTNALQVYNQYYTTRHQGAQAQSVTVEDVLLQRRIELWGEGFATFDLKRLYRGIDRSYTDSNHEFSNKISVNAGDRRWNFQLPPIAYEQFPGMTDMSKMPDLSNNVIGTVTGKTVQLSCFPGYLAATGTVGAFVSTQSDFKANVRSAAGTFSNEDQGYHVYVTGLTPLTTHYVKFNFRSADGAVYSSVKSFSTTAQVLPTVGLQVAEVSTNTVKLTGNYHFGQNSSGVTKVAFQASKVAEFNSEIWQADGQDINGNFEATLSGLSSSTQYYLRAYVECDDGSAYSPVMQVVTLEGSPISLLTTLCGMYVQSDYLYADEKLEASYGSVELVEIPGNNSQVKLINFWDGGEEIILNVDLENKRVSIDNSQVIYKHATYGDAKALPYDGVALGNYPLTGTILADGTIRFGSWAAAVTAGTFGRYKYSTLVPTTNTYAGVYTEVDYKADGTIEATYENGVSIAPVEGDINKLKITNFWDGGNFSIEAVMNFTAGTFSIAPQVISKHDTYGDCYIYPYNVANNTVDKSGTHTAGIITNGVLEIGGWAATVDAGFFGKYSKSTLTRVSAAAMRAKLRPQYAMPSAATTKKKPKSVLNFESFR
jgi:hypothetical protein